MWKMSNVTPYLLPNWSVKSKGHFLEYLRGRDNQNYIFDHLKRSYIHDRLRTALTQILEPGTHFVLEPAHCVTDSLSLRLRMSARLRIILDEVEAHLH